MIDITPWIGSVTALAGMSKAWLEVRKAGVELTKAREIVVKRVTTEASAASRTVDSSTPQPVVVVIGAQLLESLVSDVRAAAERFAKAINDPRYTPADLDREQERAELTVRAHIKRIKEFNAGALPNEELRQLALSFRCE